MNPEAQAEFDRIVSLSVEELRESDIAFLKARASYLSQAQLDKFKNVIQPVSVISYKELQQLAKEKGIKYVGKTREQLEALVFIN
jgi:hypothetical protein